MGGNNRTEEQGKDVREPADGQLRMGRSRGKHTALRLQPEAKLSK